MTKPLECKQWRKSWGRSGVSWPAAPPLPFPVSVDNQATSSQPVFLTACTQATLHISPCHHVRCTLLHTFTTQRHYQLPTILKFHPFIDKRESYRPEVLCDQCSSSSRCVHLSVVVWQSSLYSVYKWDVIPSNLTLDLAQHRWRSVYSFLPETSSGTLQHNTSYCRTIWGHVLAAVCSLPIKAPFNLKNIEDHGLDM